MPQNCNFFTNSTAFKAWQQPSYLSVHLLSLLTAAKKPRMEYYSLHLLLNLHTLFHLCPFLGSYISCSCAISITTMQFDYGEDKVCVAIPIRHHFLTTLPNPVFDGCTIFKYEQSMMCQPQDVGALKALFQHLIPPGREKFFM